MSDLHTGYVVVDERGHPQWGTAYHNEDGAKKWMEIKSKVPWKTWEEQGYSVKRVVVESEIVGEYRGKV